MGKKPHLTHWKKKFQKPFYFNPTPCLQIYKMNFELVLSEDK